ncbi:unnamed protein product [Adineta steineri]|uniref:Uncharacterized protein n=1 Tax=Adineta steineri TaxID=433720 RepID=A0A814XHE0_9BILA|nr:unnamed protein product [Adineta steineri]CAF3500185.1 unnamed protein product [Adineta steineri]CAF3589492.1 unnamed protein product [Adineta steineri]
MNPNINSQGLPPTESLDSYQPFNSNPSSWQDSSSHFRAQGHYQGPYPTSNPRIRQHGEFQQRGRYSYNKRGGGGYRPQNRESDNNSYQPTTTNYSDRNFKGFFRSNMLEDPWVNLKPQKVPSNGTTLVFDSTNQ